MLPFGVALGGRYEARSWRVGTFSGVLAVLVGVSCNHRGQTGGETTDTGTTDSGSGSGTDADTDTGSDGDLPQPGCGADEVEILARCYRPAVVPIAALKLAGGDLDGGDPPLADRPGLIVLRNRRTTAQSWIPVYRFSFAPRSRTTTWCRSNAFSTIRSFELLVRSIRAPVTIRGLASSSSRRRMLSLAELTFFPMVRNMGDRVSA